MVILKPKKNRSENSKSLNNSKRTMKTFKELQSGLISESAAPLEEKKVSSNSALDDAYDLWQDLGVDKLEQAVKITAKKYKMKPNELMKELEKAVLGEEYRAKLNEAKRKASLRTNESIISESFVANLVAWVNEKDHQLNAESNISDLKDLIGRYLSESMTKRDASDKINNLSAIEIRECFRRVFEYDPIVYFEEFAPAEVVIEENDESNRITFSQMRRKNDKIASVCESHGMSDKVNALKKLHDELTEENRILFFELLEKDIDKLISFTEERE